MGPENRVSTSLGLRGTPREPLSSMKLETAVGLKPHVVRMIWKNRNMAGPQTTGPVDPTAARNQTGWRHWPVTMHSPRTAVARI